MQIIFQKFAMESASMQFTISSLVHQSLSCHGNAKACMFVIWEKFVKSDPNQNLVTITGLRFYPAPIQIQSLRVCVYLQYNTLFCRFF